MKVCIPSVALVLLAGVCGADELWFLHWFADPSEYAAPAGEYVLRVEPTQPQGAGGASYRMKHVGEEVWARELPFTLVEAKVTDDGRVCGYAFTDGRFSGTGELVVAALDPTGEIVGTDRSPCSGPVFLHTPPNPLPVEILLDPALDRFVVRIATPELGQGFVDVWRRYRLSTMERLEDLRPTERSGFEPPSRFRVEEELPAPERIQLELLETIDLEPRPPLPDESSPTVPCAVLEDGRICIYDPNTGELHVWSEAGTALLTGEPQLVRGRIWPPLCHLFSAGDGSFGFSVGEIPEKEPLGWDASGRRMELSSDHRVASGRRWTWSPRTGLRVYARAGDSVIDIRRRLDGRWLRNLQDVAVDSAGRLIVLDVPAGSAFRIPAAVLVYAADGTPLDSLPRERLQFGGRSVRCTEEWILVSDVTPSFTLFQRSNGAAYEVRVDTDLRSWKWAQGFSTDGRSVLVVDGASRQLHRYALPAE